MWAYTGNASLGGAADWGLENKVGFHSAEGGIQESKPGGVGRVTKQEGRVRGHLWGGRKSASSILGKRNRGHVRDAPGTLTSLQPLFLSSSSGFASFPGSQNPSELLLRMLLTHRVSVAHRSDMPLGSTSLPNQHQTLLLNLSP